VQGFMPIVITPIKGYTTKSLADLKLLQPFLYPQGSIGKERSSIFG